MVPDPSFLASAPSPPSGLRCIMHMARLYVEPRITESNKSPSPHNRSSKAMSTLPPTMSKPSSLRSTERPVTYESHWPRSIVYMLDRPVTGDSFVSVRLGPTGLPADDLHALREEALWGRQQWHLTDPMAPPRRFNSDFHVSAYLDESNAPVATPTSSDRPSNIPGDWHKGHNYSITKDTAIRSLTDIRLTYFARTGSDHATVQITCPLDDGLPALKSMGTENGRAGTMALLQGALCRKGVLVREGGEWLSGAELLKDATLIGVSLDGLPDDDKSESESGVKGKLAGVKARFRKLLRRDEAEGGSPDSA